MAPVVWALQKEPWVDLRVLATGQHREMLRQMLGRLSVPVHEDLDVMRHDQSLPELTAELLTRLDRVLARESPDLVLAQGDTTTVLAVALACFYRRIDFGHVEAGLRTRDPANPFPEEINRVLAGRLARFHFCPTRSAADNLLTEGVDPRTVHVTGNTVIDTLRTVAHRADFRHERLREDRRLILLTAHRRENFGEPLERVLSAVGRLADQYCDVQVLYPVHPNPRVRSAAFRILGRHRSVILTDPLDYFDFVGALKKTHLVLTDSGGVQEEAPALGKPVLVLRRATERPEAVEAGVVRVIGTDAADVVREAGRLLSDPEAYRAMARGVSPYGDGRAAGRIVEILRKHMGPGRWAREAQAQWEGAGT
jgi:UDP-N-acetylglucosamine 2-epimerase (non-hydrolysing)